MLHRRMTRTIAPWPSHEGSVQCWFGAVIAAKRHRRAQPAGTSIVCFNGSSHSSVPASDSRLLGVLWPPALWFTGRVDHFICGSSDPASPHAPAAFAVSPGRAAFLCGFCGCDCLSYRCPDVTFVRLDSSLLTSERKMHEIECRPAVADEELFSLHLSKSLSMYQDLPSRQYPVSFCGAGSNCLGCLV